ncbi:hypothetical protein ZWY2020_001754 [Hordeum vulgare]|nr:hypothetical protein ZWY2020_001754 [Hordeum vulgare]
MSAALLPLTSPVRVADPLPFMHGFKKFHKSNKFPLLPKSSLLQRLIVEASQGGADEVRVDGLPGGARAFEICAKCCYGMVVTLNPYNVVAARAPSRCCRGPRSSGSSRGASTPSPPRPRPAQGVVWSYTYNRKAASSDEIVEARRCSSSPPAVPRDWWVEDLCELDLELYKRVMVAVKSTGDRLPPDVVEALRAYAARWLPESCRRGDIPADDDDACSLEVLETIVWLMPSDGDGSSPCGYSCQFLLNLVKLAVLTAYDVDLVEALVGRYTRRAGVDDIDGEDVFETNVEADGRSLPALCKLVDGYLTEVAAYPNLPVSSFVGLSTSMPESARPSHDALYTAIDVFLKMHPNLSKVEKRRISSLMDVKKLSKEASIHAAQNDRLPLRVVLQVLFFEQMRAAAAGSTSVALLLAIAGDGNAHLELDDDDGGGDCWKNRALALPEPPTPSAALRKQIGSMSLKLVGEDRRRAEVVVSDGRRSSPASRTRAAGCRCRRGRGGSSTGCGWSGSRRGRARW